MAGAGCKNLMGANQRCSEGEEKSAQCCTFPRWRFIFKTTSKWKNARAKPVRKGVRVHVSEKKERERESSRSAATAGGRFERGCHTVSPCKKFNKMIYKYKERHQKTFPCST